MFVHTFVFTSAETASKTPEAPAAPQAEDESAPEEEEEKKTDEKAEDEDAVNIQYHLNLLLILSNVMLFYFNPLI